MLETQQVTNKKPQDIVAAMSQGSFKDVDVTQLNSIILSESKSRCPQCGIPMVSLHEHIGGRVT